MQEFTSTLQLNEETIAPLREALSRLESRVDEADRDRREIHLKVDSVQDQVEALDKKFVKEICERKISLMDLIDSYKNWIVKTETSQIRRKLAQLNINIGETRNCIARKLKGKKTGKEFSADEFFELITESKTSLVSGPAGSGKSTLAVTSTKSWA